VSKVLTPLAILFDPVPAGGTSKLPGMVLCGMGLAGLLAIPAEIQKCKSKGSGPYRLAFLIVIDLALLIVGMILLMRQF
jgi:hypothetical protein